MSNSRADAFLNAFSCSSTKKEHNYSKSYEHRRDRPYSYGSRIPKQSPKPLTTRNTELPTYSTSRISEKPVQINSRLDFLNKSEQEKNKKKTFVAMPTKSQWENGYRPAWILSEHQNPPENYDDGYWTYKNYLKTDEIVLRKRKSNGDKAKATATNYMNKYSNSKKNKK
jgi:hypothetical protein